MWGGSTRAERVAVDVGRECESWGGSRELGRQWRAGSWCGEGVRELRGLAVGVMRTCEKWGGHRLGWEGSGGLPVGVGRECES